MKKTIILIYWGSWWIQDYEIRSFIEVVLKYKISFYLYYKDANLAEVHQQEKLNKFNIFTIPFKDFSDIELSISQILNKHEIIFIDTFFEPFVQELYHLRKNLWYTITEQYKMFENKEIQRSTLSKCNATHDVYYEKVNISELNFKKIKEKIWIPFILKPENGMGSSKVVKVAHEKTVIDYMKDFGEMNQCLIEEYIDGDMYSIDYFVDTQQNIYATPPIEMKLWKDIGVDDFFVYSCSINNDIWKKIPAEKLKVFLKETVEVCGIKNAFICHEFKHTTKKQLKTIEINGRIGARRLKILQAWYWINIYELFCQKKDLLTTPIINGFTAFAIYPPKQWELLWYNNVLLNKIRSLPSFESCNIIEQHHIWQTVWLTRNGFWNVWMIYIKNSDIIQFRKDYNFVEQNYKDLLMLK